MIGWILLVIYILGIPCWIWMEKQFFPFQEENYTVEYDGVHEITQEVWKYGVCARAGIWPLCVAIIIILIPVAVIDKLFDKL